MKVILLDELKGKGGEGDVLDVRQGYAENYLFPQRLAVPATPGNLKQLEQRRKNIAQREEGRIADAQALKEATEGKTVVVKAKMGEDGQLFGSVTTPMIAEAIQEQLGVEVDRKKIETHGAVKQAGKHGVSILIYREIRSDFTLKVEDIEGVFMTEEEKEEKLRAEREAAKAEAEAAAAEAVEAEVKEDAEVEAADEAVETEVAEA